MLLACILQLLSLYSLVCYFLCHALWYFSAVSEMAFCSTRTTSNEDILKCMTLATTEPLLESGHTTTTELAIWGMCFPLTLAVNLSIILHLVRLQSGTFLQCLLNLYSKVQILPLLNPCSWVDRKQLLSLRSGVCALLLSNSYSGAPIHHFWAVVPSSCAYTKKEPRLCLLQWLNLNAVPASNDHATRACEPEIISLHCTAYL